ncbi:MAG: hypothetical protein IJ819_00290 [Clostridiales bacterium]|nr:hypothetical protein [Clostridiales bacterium]
MSDTVKLIIEMPVEAYEYWKTHRAEYVLAEAIEKGIPLDDVKKELQNDARDYGCDEFVDGINHALEILDNIGKGE